MNRTASLIIALSLFISTRGLAQEKLPEEAQKSADAVKSRLEELKGAHAQLVFKDEAALKKTFPEHQFIVARYRQFPVARILPEGLHPSNVFGVTRKDQKLTLVQDAKALEAFFKANQAPAKDEAAARQALAAWFALAQEFHQDGFYKFEILDKEFTAESNESRQEIKGRAMVTAGGKGAMVAVLVFEDGKLAKATESSKIMPGPRPICQATKLLDADPIVRKMAEQDLLFMGIAARDYLMEQRAAAKSRELQRAIDHMWRKIEGNGW